MTAILGERDSPPRNAPYSPTQLRIQRILAPHQTINERNVTQHYLSHTRRPVWIRTCYAVDLEADCQEILKAIQGDFGPGLILDDESPYGCFGQDWTKVFLRLPLLLDSILYYNNEHLEDDGMDLAISLPNGESKLPLYNAIIQCGSVHYLIDEETLREKLVNVQFLDIYGQPVWYNKLHPDQIEIYEEHPSGGHLSTHFETCGDNPSLLRSGTLLSLEG
jgi:hypothetical protein